MVFRLVVASVKLWGEHGASIGGAGFSLGCATQGRVVNNDGSGGVCLIRSYKGHGNTGRWRRGVRRMFPLWVVGMFGVVRAGLVGEPGFSRGSCRLVCARVGVSAWGGLAQRASYWGCLCATGGRVCQGWYGMVWGDCVLGVLSCILVGGGVLWIEWTASEARDCLGRTGFRLEGRHCYGKC